MATITQVSTSKPEHPPVLDIASIHGWNVPARSGATNGALLDSALQALRVNRMRSFLTMLGIIIGVSAVIAITTLTQGVNENVRQRFANLGTNVVNIVPGASFAQGVRSAAGSRQSLTLNDVQALATELPHVNNLSPIVGTTEQVVFDNQNWNTQVRGVYPNYPAIQNLQIAEGSWFSDLDEQANRPVAVLGQTTASNLFSDANIDPIGQTIRVGTQIFQVVGVLQPIGAQNTANADDIIYAPFSAVRERLRATLFVDQIQVQVDTIDNILPTQIAIINLLRTRHHLQGIDPVLQTLLRGGSSSGSLSLTGGGNRGANGGGFAGRGGGGGFQGGNGVRTGTTGTAATRVKADPDDFQVFNGNQVVQAAQQNATVLTVLLVGVAAISLTIGGIGIMNIMLVTVTERIREIGIRLAVGARQRDVRNQFLLEALTLSIIGGVIGLFLGLFGGYALTVWLGFPFLFSLIPILLSFGVSASIGIIFGFYPALRASRLDPITALRTE